MCCIFLVTVVLHIYINMYMEFSIPKLPSILCVFRFLDLSKQKKKFFSFFVRRFYKGIVEKVLDVNKNYSILCVFRFLGLSQIFFFVLCKETKVQSRRCQVLIRTISGCDIFDLQFFLNLYKITFTIVESDLLCDS